MSRAWEPRRRSARLARTRHPWLTAALALARAPAYRIWTEGEAPAATVYGGETCLLVVEPGTVVRLASEEVPVVLWGVLGLGPRPGAADGGTVRLAPGPMAVLIGNRQAHGHGLAPEAAVALQRRLDAGVRHWSLRLCRPLPDGRERRRNFEILDGEAGIWRIRQLGEELVELAPTTTTSLLRDLVTFVSLAVDATRPEPHACAAPDQSRRPPTP